MTIFIKTGVKCDRCGEEVMGIKDTRKNAKSLISETRTLATALGWSIRLYQGKKIDVCKKCLANNGKE